EQIEVVNYHAGSRKNLVAKAEVIDQQGKVKWQKETTLDIGEDQTAVCFPVEYPEKISPTHFIKLTLTEGGKTVSDNFYWRGTEDGNYKSLLEVPAGRVESQWAMAREGNKWSIKGTIKNPTAVPAMMIRLKAVDESGEMILPVIYSDNYFFLMPGESREIGISLTSASRPSIAISGMNL
ncbi:MAG: beta-glycosidase, partial [Bacteroidaceae bacterium]|nr:beta-glycosidase [Bacteroidaceae bacterium]